METFLPSYNEIGPVVSDKKIFQVFYKDTYGKISPTLWWPCFYDKFKWLEQSWYRITKGIFLQNYIAIGPVVSDKKIF